MALPKNDSSAVNKICSADRQRSEKFKYVSHVEHRIFYLRIKPPPRLIPLKNLDSQKINFVMDLNGMEYVVDSRDEHGQPAIIGRYPLIPPSELKVKDDKKLPKKRRTERRALNYRDQDRLHGLFVLPQAIAEAKEHREECENALKMAKQQLKPQKNKEASENVIPTSRSAKVLPTQAALPRTVLSSQDTSNMTIWFYAILCAIFFAMAQFPVFRSWIVTEVVVKVGIDGVLPPLLQIVCTVGEKCMEALPLTSNVVLLLYSVFGFWPLAATFVWAIWKTVDVITFVEASFRKLAVYAMKK
jgi:hypothetical protein